MWGDLLLKNKKNKKGMLFNKIPFLLKKYLNF